MPTGVYEHKTRSLKTRKKISEKLKGKPFSEEHKKRMSESQKKRVMEGRNNLFASGRQQYPNATQGEKNRHWKGDEVGYHALHSWVSRVLGKAKKCSNCGTEEGKIHWANKDHKYRRNTDDFMELCSLCHKKYDKENNGS